MQINVTKEAADFYKKEMNLGEDDVLWLFVRVGGIGSGGFSVGVANELPDLEAVSFVISDVHFYITEADVWYFEGMKIDFNTDIEDITFTHAKGHDLFYPNEEIS